MTSQPLFIPLFFDEAEADLWLALQRVESEKRSSFIKETLRHALLGTNSEEVFRLPLNKVSKDIPEIFDGSNYPHVEAQAEEVLEDQVKQIETFSLDDLFAQTHDPQTDEESVTVTDREEVKSIPGFEYMMKYIIGTEEDKEVLMVLNQRNGSRKSGAS